MPLDNGVGLDEAQHSAPVRPQARELDPEDSVSRAELGSFARMFKHAELLAQGEVLGCEGGAADDGCPQKEIERLDQSQ